MLDLNYEDRPYEAIRMQIETTEKLIKVNNRQYKSMNGVLYSKDGTTLLYVPPMGILQTQFVVPTSVRKIGFHAFVNGGALDVICLNTIEEIVTGAFMDSKIRTLDLWNTTINYPCWNMPKLQTVIFSHTVKNINEGILFNCPNVKTIVVAEDAVISGSKLQKLQIRRRKT